MSAINISVVVTNTSSQAVQGKLVYQYNQDLSEATKYAIKTLNPGESADAIAIKTGSDHNAYWGFEFEDSTGKNTKTAYHVLYKVADNQTAICELTNFGIAMVAGGLATAPQG